MDVFYPLVEGIVILAVILIFCGSMFVRLAFRGHKVKQDFTYTPSVTVLMSCFNEGKAVYETIQKVLDSDYPKDKLFVIAFDDCSKDDSWEWMQKVAEGHSNVTVIRNEHNLGKAKTLLQALDHVKTDLILNIDSDGALHHRAILELATCFVDPEVGAVGGNVMVRNANQNWLTQMQTLQYNSVFQAAKVGETFSGSVNCISGALCMIRTDIYRKIAPDIAMRRWFGQEIKEGEDRFLTNLVLNLKYKTYINNRSKVFTDVPSTFKVFFSQQLRWRRGFMRILMWIMKPSVFIKKVESTTPMSVFRLYFTALLIFIIPALITWILIVHGIFILMMMKLYIMILLMLIHTVNYIVAKRIGNEIDLGIVPFIMLPLWMMVDLTLVTALAFLTLTSVSWETRSK